MDGVLFIGGTALARTHLPDGRLSEDIDLIALGNRSEIAAQLTRELPRAVLRRFGRLKWRPSPSEVAGSDSAYLMTEDESVVIGAIDSAAAELFRRYGPTNKVPQRWQFSTAPSEQQWHAQLAGQTRLTVSARQALEIVCDAWEQRMV
ncbi:nucleotidyl transferase AbiEii/AbiGii toxin family protein [Nocardia sp. NPDC050793]|uniref:nucleotidyl transferase AbiEii/AbiGii toxin family protein n=1 Tax=Nocardia sp. NPDC050793 TaxID=3155159 RepID=UPI0033F99EB7